MTAIPNELKQLMIVLVRPVCRRHDAVFSKLKL
jgi:hypothetical protein